ncbi:MAG TPA: HD domain-containing protein [Gemmatimonadaceae bacterium]|nr:HD domain-containing protein [Gemmatimonadaceae bacterium]
MIQLPEWACVSERRRAHIERVTELLETWAHQLGVPPEEARAWRDAGLLHDSLRDAPEPDLRALVPRPEFSTEMLHGPAVAARLERAGETRREMLDAIRWHTVGSAGWKRLGRALFMADFLEPGRNFARADRAYLAQHVPLDFDRTFRQVVRMRLEHALREGHTLFPETVELWNLVR